jgi:hypothetical protein
MIQLLLTVKDKSTIDELKRYGYITYISDYTSLIGFECEDKAIKLLENHPNIVELENACTTVEM